MNAFSVALFCFVMLHVGVAATGLRTTLVKVIGEWPYRAVFSLMSIALLVWLIVAFGAMRRDLWDPLNGQMWAPTNPVLTGFVGAHNWIGLALSFLGVTLAVAGVLTPSPTLVGFESTLARENVARGVLRITRHPFLWGVVLWSAGHLLLNGERFAVMLFGALAAMAVLGARSIDRKAQRRNPEAWAAFAAVTSNLPFAAIAQRRNKLALNEAWARLAVGAVAAFGAAAWHETPLAAMAIAP